MFLNILLFVSIALLSYAIILKIKNDKLIEKVNKYINDKNEKYYIDFIKNYEKSKKIKLTDKLNIIYKINLLIEKANFKRSILINPISLLVMGVFFIIIAYNIAFSFLKIITLSLIVALPFGLLPIVAISYIGTYKEEKLEKVFLNFLLQLKNHANISNDITSAFSNIETIEPLQTYIRKFNLELNSGVKFEKAIENLKEKISIQKFKEFFSNVKYCYLYGGNFSALIDKNYKSISELQNEKSKRLQETKGARIVLIILMALNIYVYMTYIKNNYENYLIMQRSFIGMAILYWNFISMWILLFLSSKVKKLDY